MELGLCFSLIVNRRREHRLYAASRERCPVCGRASSREVAARLVAPDCQLSAGQRALLRARLAREIDEKIALATDVGHEVGA